MNEEKCIGHEEIIYLDSIAYQLHIDIDSERIKQIKQHIQDYQDPKTALKTIDKFLGKMEIHSKAESERINTNDGLETALQELSQKNKHTLTDLEFALDKHLIGDHGNIPLFGKGDCNPSARRGTDPYCGDLQYHGSYHE